MRCSQAASRWLIRRRNHHLIPSGQPLRAVVPSRFLFTSPSTSSPSPSSSPPVRSLPPLFDYSADLSPTPTPLLSPLLSPSSSLPSFVRIVEVGPRDGLQNEPATLLSPEVIVELIDRLTACHLPTIEAASFVSPRWVPSMAASDAVLRAITRSPSTTYSALTPNAKGLERALDASADEVAVFASASEGFSRANLNCSIAESLTRFHPVMEGAKKAGVRVRGYVSCVIGCPYDGWTAPPAVADVTSALLRMGCYEVSLGDTIGVGTPGRVTSLLTHLFHTASIPSSSIAVHFHDTYGQALANVLASLLQGVGVVDASVGGLGGCPYAVGATGNVATEDVVYMLHGCGIHTGVELRGLIETARWISRKLGREVQSRVGRALGSKIT